MMDIKERCLLLETKLVLYKSILNCIGEHVKQQVITKSIFLSKEKYDLLEIKQFNGIPVKIWTLESNCNQSVIIN